MFCLAVMTMSMMSQQPRAEYPRPQFERQEWVNLNGQWTYTFDFVGSGLERRFYESKGFEGHITVPFCPESKLSGVGYTDFINHIWYQRPVSMPASWKGRDVKLNFGAVYYNSEVFIDGKLVGRHFGGSTSFSLDVTRFLTDGNKVRVVMRFKGRQMAHQEIGLEILMKFADAVSELGAVDKKPVLEGRNLTMFIAPQKNK